MCVLCIHDTAVIQTSFYPCFSGVITVYFGKCVRPVGGHKSPFKLQRRCSHFYLFVLVVLIHELFGYHTYGDLDKFEVGHIGVEVETLHVYSHILTN